MRVLCMYVINIRVDIYVVRITYYHLPIVYMCVCLCEAVNVFCIQYKNFYDEQSVSQVRFIHLNRSFKMALKAQVGQSRWFFNIIIIIYQHRKFCVTNENFHAKLELFRTSKVKLKI